jgi:hypothetical protein
LRRRGGGNERHEHGQPDTKPGHSRRDANESGHGMTDDPASTMTSR